MPDDMNGTAPTPASANVFDVDEDSTLLNEKESDFFHRTGEVSLKPVFLKHAVEVRDTSR
jgi:hypothetical protein